MGDVTPPARVEIYDTTLRDGSQQVGLDLTVTDKLRVATGAYDLAEGQVPAA